MLSLFWPTFVIFALYMMTFQMKVNYHTHSRYCDGKGELREYVEYAIAHGFTHLGFSGHAPVPFQNNFAIDHSEYGNYCNEVRALREEYSDRIKIHLGLEIDYIPGVLDDFSSLISEGGLEYCIGSVHLVNDRSVNPDDLWFIDGSHQEVYDDGIRRIFNGDARKAVTAFFHQNNEMIERVRPTIIGHFDKVVMHNKDRYFTYDEPWFQSLVNETVDLIRQYGIICEINTRGLYKGRHTDFYPASSTIKHLCELNIPVLVGSDAHAPADLDRFEGAYQLLHELGCRNIVYEL